MPGLYCDGPKRIEIVLVPMDQSDQNIDSQVLDPSNPIPNFDQITLNLYFPQCARGSGIRGGGAIGHAKEHLRKSEGSIRSIPLSLRLNLPDLSGSWAPCRESKRFVDRREKVGWHRPGKRWAKWLKWLIGMYGIETNRFEVFRKILIELEEQMNLRWSGSLYSIPMLILVGLLSFLNKQSF